MPRRATTVLSAGVLLALALPLSWALADGGGATRRPTLPTLPPVAEQVEGLYDEQGCLRTALDEVDCSVRADEVDEALIDGGPAEERHLAGFVGPQYLAHPRGAGPVVLEDTVRVRRTGGTWAARGLARNEGELTLARVEVAARLLDRSGALLAEVDGTSPVTDVRPGEPVPFDLVVDLPADAVADVEWSARAVGGGDGIHRTLGWTVWWEEPAGDRPAIDLYLYRETGPGPHPHVVFGSVENVGDEPVAAPEVVMAWLDGRGRVALVATAPVRDAAGRPATALAPGTAADALVRRDRPVPAGAAAMVWVQGR